MKARITRTRRTVLLLGAAGSAALFGFGCSRREPELPAAAPPEPPKKSDVPAPPELPKKTDAPAPSSTPAASTPAASAPVAQAGGAATEKVDENAPTAKALNYRHDASEVKDPKRTPAQVCSSCQFYAVDRQSTSWAPCSVFQNKLVAANGWCSSWIKKA
jgi:High potential iron-sulfur protein